MAQVAPGAPARNTREVQPPVARTLEFPPESSSAAALRAAQQAADKEMYGEVLATPITLDRVREVEQLELTRLELLQEAEYIAAASTDAQKIKEDAICAYEEARAH